ncbi:MAG TPA: ABC transporter ATP-binding protein [Candidatus Aminicenantes bacterium]|nr:ABC transporter ATP-binding protein [Candidatus Aminicenantes bacterium]
MEPMIRVEGVAKKFCRNLRRSMWYGMRDIARNAAGLRTRSGLLRKDEFWALRGIDLEVKRGEVLGVIGPNGSGKSTLLKLLNGIYWPDAGRVSVRGRVGALIEVGAGFHPMLSGRENIYVNGAVLGMSKKEIDARFDDIVAFADIGDFLDMPVKHYSSGMFVRLGFAVAVHCDPDVLLIDEILAVGDMSFRRRCYNRIDEMKKRCAIILVSHNMFQIGRICSTTLFLRQGQTRFIGSSARGILAYYESVSNNANNEDREIRSEGPIRMVEEKHSLDGNRLEIDFIMETDPEHCEIPYGLSLTLLDASDHLFAQTNSLFQQRVFQGPGRVRLTIPGLNLNHGIYRANLMVYDADHSRLFSMYRNLFSFSVSRRFVAGATVYFEDASWESLPNLESKP